MPIFVLWLLQPNLVFFSFFSNQLGETRPVVDQDKNTTIYGNIDQSDSGIKAFHLEKGSLY
jgi:hypothetical protein